MNTLYQSDNIRIGCDGCPARAVYYIRFSFGALYLCLHHWNKNEAVILNHSNYLDSAHLLAGALK